MIARAVVAALLLVLAPAAARADDGDHSVTWVVATSEVTTALSTFVELAVLPDTSDNGTRLTIMGIGSLLTSGVVGYLSWRGQWAPQIPRAMHGALWCGLDLFILGSVLPFALGMEGANGFEFGPVAYTLGALGLIEGALAGALLVEDGTENEVWLYMGAGLLAGLLLVGIAAIGSGGTWGPEEGEQWIGWTMFLSIGAFVSAAHLFAALNDAEAAQ